MPVPMPVATAAAAEHGPAGQAVPRCQPRPDGPRGPGLWPPALSTPGPGWRGWASPPEAALPGAVALGARLAAEEKMLLLSPRSLARLAPAAAGRAPGCARPRPPGILKDAHGCYRQTWQRRGGRTPKRGGKGGLAGGEQEEKAAASGHSAATEEDAGSPPARPSPWPGSRHVRAASGPLPGSPGAPAAGTEAALFRARPAEQRGPPLGAARTGHPAPTAPASTGAHQPRVWFWLLSHRPPNGASHPPLLASVSPLCEGREGAPALAAVIAAQTMHTECRGAAGPSQGLPSWSHAQRGPGWSPQPLRHPPLCHPDQHPGVSVWALLLEIYRPWAPERHPQGPSSGPSVARSRGGAAGGSVRGRGVAWRDRGCLPRPRPSCP